MSISVCTIKQNLNDLDACKESLPKDVKDAIERVIDDSKEMLERFDEISSNVIK